MANPISAPSISLPSNVSPAVSTDTTGVVPFVMDKFQGLMSTKESTLNLQKETLQTIVDDMNLMSDKLDLLKDTTNWDTPNINPKPVKYPFEDLIGKSVTSIQVNMIDELAKTNNQLKSAGFVLQDPNLFSFNYDDVNQIPVSQNKIYDKPATKNLFYEYNINYSNLLNYPADGLYYYDDKPGFEGTKFYYAIINQKIVNPVDFQSIRVPATQAELNEWNDFSTSKKLLIPDIYPFNDLVDLRLSDPKVQAKIQDITNANNELKSLGMNLGNPNIFLFSTLVTVNNNVERKLLTFNTAPQKINFDFIPTQDGIYFFDKPFFPGSFAYKAVVNGVLFENISNDGEFRIPTSQDELAAWNKFSFYKKSADSTINTLRDPILLNSKNVNANISVNYNMAFVTQSDGTTSPLTYSISAVSPEDKSKQVKDTFFYLTDDIKNPKTYYLSSGSGEPTIVPASKISLFINNPSDTDIQNWRTQFAEKQVQLTQRSTEFQAFLNTTVAEFNTYSDLFTNILKTIFSSMKDIVSKF
jgi:hypothetical protein